MKLILQLSYGLSYDIKSHRRQNFNATAKTCPTMIEPDTSHRSQSTVLIVL